MTLPCPPLPVPLSLPLPPPLPLPLSLRPATVGDAAVVARHRVAMFSDMGQVPTAELADQLLSASTQALAALLQEGTYVSYLAEEPGGRVIAGAGMHIRPQLPRMSCAGTAIITGSIPLMVNVYTAPQWRRRGIARTLVLALMRWSSAQGFDHILLHASDEGRALYRSLGFTATTEMRWCQGPSA